ncbi:MAG TPA: penicillin-binding protein [Ignavibacteriaceae bacterium]|nr:penicillin-binding protein [Ignavibacteriaceae bacterium]
MNINRLIFVVFCVFIAFGAVVARLFYVQIVKGDEYKFFAQRQQTSTQVIPAERGLIFDRNNVLLSYNKNDFSFYLDLKRVRREEDIDTLVKIFSRTFSKPVEHYYSLIKNSKRRVTLEKKVSGTEVIHLKEIKMNGFYFEEDPTRIYPYNNLASHLIGHLDVDLQGVDGIEKTLNTDLRGIDGKRVILRDANNNLITVQEGATIPSKPGLNAVLTINKTYQNILEEELQYGLEQFGGDYTLGILMDPNTGEIIALSNQRDYNLNEYNASSDSIRRNKALTDTYEPGSTFKSIAMSIFLEKNICSENEQIFGENGSYQFKSIKIRDSHPEGMMSLKEVFAKSSNIGMAKISQKIDDEEFYLAVRAFGFGNITNITLPGEVKGKLKNPMEWSAYSKSSLSFGYEVSVTPLQLVTAYSAIINGGILYQPQIVKELKNVSGNVVKKYEPKEIRKVISPTTSQKMREFLREAVEKGTGKKAKPVGISAGGKTGTSRKLIEGTYSRQHYNASFVGFFPVENPKYVLLVLVNSPSNSSYYGGDVAAPIFKKVAERIAELDESLWKFNTTTNNIIQMKNVSLETTYPNIERTRKIEKKISLNKTRMPNLISLDMREVVNILNKLNIQYEISGSGRVVEQSVEPGSHISKKVKCKVKLSQNVSIATNLY